MSSSSVALTNIISAQIYIYVGIPIFVFGIVGGILNVIIFVSLRTFRQSSCGIYLILMSLCDIIQLIFGFLNRIVTSGFLSSWSTNSLFSCTMKMYIIHICALISLSYICLSTIDQYLATSKYRRFQEWSTRKVAYRLCPIISLFWIIFCIPHIIYYNEIPLLQTNKSVCVITNEIYQNYLTRFYFPILLNTFPTLIMIIFGLLAYRNVKGLSYRTVPLVRRQHERQITAMVLLQSLISVLVITPYLVLSSVTSNIQLSNDPVIIAHIQLVLTVTICINTLYFASPFYIYISVSHRYRQQLVYVLRQIDFQRWCRGEYPLNQVAAITE